MPLRIIMALCLFAGATRVHADDAASQPPNSTWKVGAPIVTYFAGPPMSDAVAEQMAAEGFNLVWTDEKNLDTLQKHGLRGLLQDPLLVPESLDAPETSARLNALIERVSQHRAFYGYYLTDEPSAAAFPKLGKLTEHLRARDPAHMAYINLFPIYSTPEQLGVAGGPVPVYQGRRGGGSPRSRPLIVENNGSTAYYEHLRQYMEIVKPQLVSYDHYQFRESSDTNQYFLNLSIIRHTAQRANTPFLNIVQACTWAPGQFRVPSLQEVRYLVYTTAAYGAEGISYYVYSAPGHVGGIRSTAGVPTPLQGAMKELNRDFTALVTELEPLRSQAVYHTVLREPGCEPVPPGAAFRCLDSPAQSNGRGLLLGYFGPPGKPASRVLVVNLDYRAETRTTLGGPAPLESFDTATGKWTAVNDKRAELLLPPGGGQLWRVAQAAE